MKRFLRYRINRLLSFFLSLLGFTAVMTCCNAYGPPIDDYGHEHDNLDVSGVVTNNDGEPLPNIQIVVKKDNNVLSVVYTDDGYSSETGYYNEAALGHYSAFIRDYNCEDSVMVVASDTTDVYLSDSVKVESKWNDWNLVCARADFRLNKK
ncbi:MAG: radical SAM-associated putative lipoprotein [Paludibacteraceae bacterium]|nr:radical SAM-associated putative lipoprotein [Paludibacteraceae bacterium]